MKFSNENKNRACTDLHTSILVSVAFLGGYLRKDPSYNVFLLIKSLLTNHIVFVPSNNRGLQGLLTNSHLFYTHVSWYYVIQAMIGD